MKKLKPFTWTVVIFSSHFLSANLLNLFLNFAPAAWAYPVIPYLSRNVGYNAWSSTVHGDIRTLGMSGALVGLGDSWSGTSLNPAGLALALDSSGAQINGNTERDANLQDYGQTIHTGNFGAVASNYPWGLSMGYWSPHSESAYYNSPTTGSNSVLMETDVKEFRVTYAHIYLENRLALGASLILSDGIRTINDGTGERVDHAMSVNATLGALYQMPHRFLLGVSYMPPNDYDSDSGATPAPPVAHFFRSMHSPYVLGAGAGWVPNRYLRGGVSLLMVGSTGDSALVSDQTRLVGQKMTFQPRLGVEYRWADFPDLHALVELGSYLEASRTQGAQGRYHHTLGLEFNPWVVNTGLGLDQAPGYQSMIVSIGVDVIRILRKMKVIPPDRPRDYGHWFPDPIVLSDSGLPRPLAKDWDGSGATPVDIYNIGIQVPAKLGEKFMEATQSIKEVLSTPFQVDPPPPARIPDGPARWSVPWDLPWPE